MPGHFTDGSTGFDYTSRFGEGGFGSGGLDRFRGDKRSDAWALDNLPFDLLKQFDILSEFGKFGKGGVNRIVSDISGRSQRSLSQGRRLKRAGMIRRGGVGRRLGPEAGAIENLLGNQAAQENVGLSRTIADLIRGLESEQATSQVGGLSGIAGVMDFLRQRYDREQDVSRSKTGILDWAAVAAEAVPG